MNHKGLAIAPIVAVAPLALTAAGFAIPPQAFAHYGHHHNNNSNNLKVDQQINQLNNCTSSAQCANVANNDAQIHR